MRGNFFKTAVAGIASFALLIASGLIETPAVAATSSSVVSVPSDSIGIMVQVDDSHDNTASAEEIVALARTLQTPVELTNARDLGLGWWAFSYQQDLPKASQQALVELIRTRSWVKTTSFDVKLQAARVLPVAKSLTFTSSSYVPSSSSLTATNAYDNTTPTDGKITVSWKRPTRKPSSYTLAYSSSSTGPWKTVTVSSSASSLSRTISSLTPGTKYFFKVRAKYPRGYSSYSRVVSATPYVQPSTVKFMSPPKVTASTSITARWFPLASTAEFGGYAAVSYRVDVYKTDNTKKGSCTPSGTDTFCTVSGLTEGDYYARVVTINPTDTAVTFVDPSFGYPYFEYWYLSGNYGINLEGAWNASKGGAQTITVAVIDTGFTATPILKANSWWNNSTNSFYGYDFIENSTSVDNYSPSNDGNGTDNNPADPGDYVTDAVTGEEQCSTNEQDCSSWHGTQVGSIIAGWTENEQANTLIGIAPRVKLLPIRSLGPDGGSSSELARAINYAAGIPITGVVTNAHPANVVNISMGTDTTKLCGSSDAVEVAITAARAKGVIFVTAAGNFGDPVNRMKAYQSYPGNCFGTINVGATNENGDRAYYSNRGNGYPTETYSGIDISAPGGDGNTSGGTCGLSSCIAVVINKGKTTPTNEWDFATNQGTSFAAPVVTAIVALMLSVDPTLTFDEVATILADTAKPFGGSTYCGQRNYPVDGYYECGRGIVDAGAAIESLTAN